MAVVFDNRWGYSVACSGVSFFKEVCEEKGKPTGRFGKSTQGGNINPCFK